MTYLKCFPTCMKTKLYDQYIRVHQSKYLKEVIKHFVKDKEIKRKEHTFRYSYELKTLSDLIHFQDDFCSTFLITILCIKIYTFKKETKL